MQELLYIRGDYCPYCKRADTILAKLRKQNKAYAAVPIRIIDEVTQQEEADRYGYRVVPSFVINGRLFWGGVPTEDILRKVLEAALEA
nr:thioredoxin family protein [Maliibacterium massiliense]